MKQKPAFSTDKSVETERKEKKSNKMMSNKPLSEGPLKIRLEKNKRAGKTVTILFNIPLNASEAKSLMKTIQRQTGTGATFKNEQIEIQGDKRDHIELICQSQGIKVVRAGG